MYLCEIYFVILLLKHYKKEYKLLYKHNDSIRCFFIYIVLVYSRICINNIINYYDT